MLYPLAIQAGDRNTALFPLRVGEYLHSAK